MNASIIKTLHVDLAYPEAELVFGLVYPTGTDYSGVLLTLENFIKRFNYRPNVIRLSEFIPTIADKMGASITIDRTSEASRIDSMMTAGDKLCGLAQDESFIVSAGIAEISRQRAEKGSSKADQPSPKTAHIIVSLKRPGEVELLRAIYGPGFYLIGIFASEKERNQYLTQDKNISWKRASLLMKRDQHEEVPFGQRCRDTFQLSDVFIQLKGHEYKQHLERFLDLVFGCPFITPGPDEHAMFLAYSAALRSGQLSRQIGSAIRSEGGDIIAIGCNEVPAAGGGAYWPGSTDARDHVRGFDSNDIEQAKIVEDIVKCLGIGTGSREAFEKLKNSRLMDITEYGRAVHSEMDAILTCARIGVSPVGGTVFTTTFPCHNCTRHIVAAGIKRVVYIEPYPKSMAEKLHQDAIELPGTKSTRTPDGRERIPFEPFVGIGPRRFFDLFSMKMSSGYPVKRKTDEGYVNRWKRFATSPRIQMLPTSYIQREKIAAAKFMSTVETKGGGA